MVNKNEYSLFVKIGELDLDAFLHCNDLTYSNNGEQELNNYKKGDKLKVKVLEIKVADQKNRVGLRQTQPDPFDWFKDKKIKQAITVKIISTDSKGLIVRFAARPAAITTIMVSPIALETANNIDPIIPGKAAGITTCFIVSDLVAPTA